MEVSEIAKQAEIAESQRQRWLKYGGNVVLTCIVAIALAIMVTYASERKPWRIDTTAAGLYSLKPQTLKILHRVNKPIRLISLYTHSKPPQSEDEDENAPAVVPADEAAQTVSDLLQEYANANPNITVETIDPVTNPARVDDLIEQVEAKYGGEVNKYRDFVNSFQPRIKQIQDIANPEVQAVFALPLSQDTDKAILLTLQEAFLTVQEFPKDLSDLEDQIQRPLHQKPPDYKGAADAITQSMTNLSNLLDAVISNFNALEKRGGLPPAVAQYMTTSLPHYQTMKKLADDTVAADKKLGELKLDTLRSALRERNTILVMGDTEWRSINYDQVWQLPAQRVAGLSDEAPKPRFAGEQQVTAAILGVTSGGKKPMVAIVRAGGPPLAESMGPFGGGNTPLADAAGRLALYNFDVVEKDLTGQFAAQSQGMVSEPSDDEIKDATWIVWGFSDQQPNPETGEAPPSIAPQVAAHLKAGGSAVIITGFHQDAMSEALADWGVNVRTDAMIVHEKIPAASAEAGDIVQEVLRLPYVFDLHDYGDHPLAKPLESLEGLFGGMSPVELRPVKGYDASPLLPIPTAPEAPKTWGTVNFQAIQNNQAPVYDPSADVPGPLYAGAALEHDRSRLVVLAAGDFANNQWLELTARTVDPNAPPVIRFPGNGELFTNSVFWAAHQDTLIDISPAAMDIGRIGNISSGMLNFLRVGILLIGLPGLVIVTGLGVYLQRRD
ncbi:MAG TPA: Gldg family protein [Tepidisphaeraceae bacterium]|nr:Gldg family protein [Tepidisphaeraceae bacterium]